MRTGSSHRRGTFRLVGAAAVLGVIPLACGTEFHATLTNTDVLAGSEGSAGDGPGASNDGVPGIAQPELNLADL